MKPILFAENSTTFATNGIGRLSDAIDCVVTEERNGIYELEMTYPMDGAHYSDIGIRSIIMAKPSANASNQPFRVYKISRPINGKVKIYAQHISYDLSKNTCMPFSISASGSACSATLQALKTNAVESCPFTFWTNVTTVASYTQKTPASIKQRLGGIAGSVLDQFGGEYEYDKYTVKLWRNRGSSRDITLRYGKNIIDLDQEEDIANTVTGIVPFWTNTDNTETVTLPEKAVYSSHASQYSHYLTVPLDMSDEWENKPSEAALRAAATVYVNQEGFGVPKVSTKVNFVNLADTDEYRNILPLQNVNLCDTIKVQFEKIGIDTTAEIVKTVYDVLGERYNSIEVGSLKSNLATTITDIEKNGMKAIDASGKRVFADVGSETQDLINNATAWLTSSGGYVIAVKNNDGSWKELLFLDTNNVSTAHNVLRINQNGIGFSSNGVGGPFTQAWTLDGKLVIGGTNVPSITCYDSNSRILFQASANGVQVNSGVITLKDNNNNIVFQASSSGVVWNAANSSMDSSGKLIANNAELTGGKIKLGGSANGVLEMYNSSGAMIGEWNRDRLRYKNGSNNIIDLRTYGNNSVIMFDEESYIDGTGTGTNGGINFNARKCVFSVNSLGITSVRNGMDIRYGRDGNVITGLDTTELTGICCNLRGDGSGGLSWDVIDIEYINGWTSHNTVNGLVVS